MSDFKTIGKSIPRLDGPPKVTGRADFLADRLLSEIPGSWAGGTVRSEVPYGKLKAINKNPKFDWTKAVVITARDLPAKNQVHIVRDEYPILADETVNYVTQAVALVAAPDKATLKEAMSNITLDIEPMDAVLDIDESLAKKAVIWGDDNIVDSYRVDGGDVCEGFAQADLIVEGIYTTGLQEQMYIEPQGMAAVPGEDGSIELIGSIQCPYYVLTATAGVLGIPESKVRVVQAEVGGAFGGKEDYPSILGARAALLASKIGRPVAMIYDRAEDILATPKRHPSRITHRTGVKKDGTITAMEIDIILDAGAYTTLTMVILQRTVLHATGCYYTPLAQVRGRAVATNTPPNGAFRGFGAPQSIFAVERHMDKIARELGMDPLELRLKNTIKNGMRFPFKQVLDSGVSAEDVLKRAAELSGYKKKRKRYALESAEAIERGDRIVKGIGISVALHGGGFTGSAEDTMGTMTRVSYSGGVFNLHTSGVDMGQGSATVLPQIAAETLGVGIDSVRHPRSDTFECPNSGPTVASRSTMFIGRVLHETCIKLIDKLKSHLAEAHGTGQEAVRFEGGCFAVSKDASSKKISILEAADMFVEKFGELEETHRMEYTGESAWNQEKFEGDAYKGYGWIAQTVEVEVDMDTYEVNPVESTIVAEVGRAINPTLAEGQLEGGLLQGFGWSHIESLDVGSDGRYNASRMSEYLVPTTLDSPKWNVDMLEVPCEAGAYGSKGIGELPANGGAPAFISAVENATGVCADYIPLTGEKLWRELTNLKGDKYEGEGGEPR